MGFLVPFLRDTCKWKINNSIRTDAHQKKINVFKKLSDMNGQTAELLKYGNNRQANRLNHCSSMLQPIHNREKNSREWFCCTTLPIKPAKGDPEQSLKPTNTQTQGLQFKHFIWTLFNTQQNQLLFLQISLHFWFKCWTSQSMIHNALACSKK